MAETLLNESWNVGAAWNSGTSNYTFRLEVILESQSVASNASTITVNKYVKGNSGNSWYGTACTDVFDGGVSDTFTYNPATAEMRNVEVKYHTKQFTITHSSDGTYSLYISTSFTRGSNTYAPNTNSKSFTVALPTIARASNISLSSSSINIDSTSGSVSYTITPYSSSFTHTLVWTLGSGGATITNASSGSISYSAMLNALSSASSGTLTLTLTTLSNGSAIGSNSATASVTVSGSSIKPTIVLSNISVYETKISGYLIAGYSKATIESTTTNSSGSSSVSTSFTAENGSLDTPSTTSTDKVTIHTDTLPTSSTGYTLKITATARDSRGNTNAASKTATVYAYAKPTVNLTAYRVANSTSTTRDDSGAYAYITFSGTLGASVNGQNSIQSTVCTYSGSVSGTATNGIHIALADNQSITVTCTVTDKVSSSTASVIVSTITYPLDLRDDGSGNVSIGLGGIAPEHNTNDYNDGDYIMPHLPIRHVEQNFHVTDTGTDLNDYTEPGIYFFDSSHTPTNIPAGVNGWLMVMKSPRSSAVKQMWWRQGTNNSNDFNTYIRQYSASAWSSWVRLMYAGETVSRANNATYVDWTQNTSTTGASYYIPFGTGYGTNTSNRGLQSHNGLSWWGRVGTASTDGRVLFKLGNTIDVGTEGNMWGELDIYPQTGAYYGRLLTVSSLTANRAYTLPNASGTVLITDSSNYVQLYSGTLSSGSTTFTGSNYSAYLIVGAEGRGYKSSITVPRALITTTAQQWMVTFYGSSNIENVRFSLTASAATGGTITLTWQSGKTIREIYGIK